MKPTDDDDVVPHMCVERENGHHRVHHCEVMDRGVRWKRETDLLECLTPLEGVILRIFVVKG